MADPLRFGLVGTGGIHHAHVMGLLARPDVGIIAAAADPAPQGLQQLAEQVPDLRTFGSLDEMLDGAELDATIICTPHHLHLRHALAAVRRGLPAIVEKPVTMSTAELRELHAEAERAGVFVLPGQMQRFDRDNQWTRARMDAEPDLIGTPRTFSIDCMHDLRGYAQGRPHWLFDATLAGGGVAISLAVHKLDLLRYLTGADYERVNALARYEAPFVNGAESAITATLQLQGDLIGVLHGDYLAPRTPYSESFRLYGTGGTLAMHADIGSYAGRLMLDSTTQMGAEGTVDIVGISSRFAAPAAVAGLEDLSDNPFENQLVHFVEVVRDAAEPHNSLEINFNTMACVEALGVSAREGRAVEVEKW